MHSLRECVSNSILFPISRDPPEGGTRILRRTKFPRVSFPISRDPPEGGTGRGRAPRGEGLLKFPISRDPPEGGTKLVNS